MIMRDMIRYMRSKEELRMENLGAIIEAILFVSGEPMNVSVLAHALDLTVSELDEQLNALRDEYIAQGHGLRLNRFGGSVQLTTCADAAPYIQRVLQPPTKQSLSNSAMETLSVVAYRQPVTKGEIEAVRGVKCDYSVQSLISKGLIEEAGRRETLGRPVEYRTTEKFLMHLGIESLDQLPALELSKE